MAKTKSRSKNKSTKKTRRKKASAFTTAVTLDRAARDIGARPAGRGKKGKRLFLAGKTTSSSGVLFTGGELVKAKKRSLTRATGKRPSL